MATALAGGLAAGSAATVAYARPAVRPAAGLEHLAKVPRSLGGITCSGMSFCMGVGNYGSQVDGTTFSQTWNGKAWKTMPVPEPGLGYGLAGVSCLSSTNCLAVGASGAGAGQLSDAWNGRTWRMLPVPARPKFSELTGVACLAASDCIAVGDGGTPGSATVLAQWWNGMTWSQLAPADPAGASFSTFSGISCTGRASCMAVGRSAVLQGAHVYYRPLAESWNGKTWTMLPSPAGSTGLRAVSCPTVSICVAVGVGPAVTSIGSAVWNGSSWTTLTTQNPHPGASLTGVSCASATSCIAVGTTPGGPFAERWSGGLSWQLTPVPRPAASYGLAGVSCSRPADCIAVGGAGDDGPPLSVYSSFAVAWNGQRWRVLRTGRVDVLTGVSCGSLSHCLMVGGYLDPADINRTLAESWNSKRMRLVSAHGLRGVIGPVSCPAATFCVAGSGSGIPTTVSWNGKRWTRSASATRFYIIVLSCAARNFCAGGTGNSSGEVWNGKKWRNAPFDQAAVDNSTTSISGLSCLRPHFCMATGHWEQDTDGASFGPVTEVWTGSRWSIIDPPNTQQGELGPVSCSSPTNCTTTGFTLGTAGSPHLFAARWNGHTWQVYHLPGKHFGYGFAGPAAISCPTATSCLAVGHDFVGGVVTDVAFAWNGHVWLQIKTTRPGGIDSVSCPAANQCLATGSPGIRTLAKLWNGSRWRLIKTINP